MHRNLVHLVGLIVGLIMVIMRHIPLVKDEGQETYPTPLLVLFFSHFISLSLLLSCSCHSFSKVVWFLHIQDEMHRYTSMTDDDVPTSRRR